MLFLFIWFALAWTWALQGKRMMDAELSWDEFRLVKAIADTRSLSGAAERLGLNHSTIFRRLSALEKLVGVKLFERSRGGYETTAAGREMAVLAGAMSDSIVDFERRVAGRDANPTGLLRVTTGELIGRRFVPALIDSLSRQISFGDAGTDGDQSRGQSLAPRGGRRVETDERSVRDARGTPNLLCPVGALLSHGPPGAERQRRHRRPFPS